MGFSFHWLEILEDRGSHLVQGCPEHSIHSMVCRTKWNVGSTLKWSTGARMTAGVGTGYIRAPEVVRSVERFQLSVVSCRLSLVYTARVLMYVSLCFVSTLKCLMLIGVCVWISCVDVYSRPVTAPARSCRCWHWVWQVWKKYIWQGYSKVCCIL